MIVMQNSFALVNYLQEEFVARTLQSSAHAMEDLKNIICSTVILSHEVSLITVQRISFRKAREKQRRRTQEDTLKLRPYAKLAHRTNSVRYFEFIGVSLLFLDGSSLPHRAPAFQFRRVLVFV